MPNHAKGDVIRRQWEMLRLIPPHDHPGKSAPELVATLENLGYPVTRRTVERDLEALRQALPLEPDVTARPVRWRWRKSRGLDIPGMEAAEAMALFMMRDAMGAHLPGCFLDALQSRFAEANRTLQTVASPGARVRGKWSDKVRVLPSHIVLKAPRINARLLQVLQRALLSEVALEAQYQSLQDEAPRSRVLYPRALILRGSSLYLIADPKGGTGPKHYAVHRFTQLRPRELEPFFKTRFDLDHFLADGVNQFGDGRPIRLKAIVSAPLARILRDTPLSDDMTLTPKAAEFTMTATVRDTWALHSWLLGHGENVCVLQPAALRDQLATRLAAAVERYRH
jgi:predicted DNA-binding transcriptional regulator YafY